MKNNLGKLKHIACALTLGVCSMQGATAGIIFTHTQPGQGTLDNIRFGAEDGVVLQGTTVTGAVGPRSEMFLIDFIGNESLAVQSGSPTAFRAADGGLQRLDVGVRDGGFTSLFLNLRAQPGGTAASRYADIAVSAYGGETATYRLNFLPGMNANNLFQVSATGNTLL
ncbi:hypothetical protein, partial [Massilia timonae]|uniref:hypothetical protein n=1 Tax=Massilia timonae TaxID=47229 RepID=UPI00289AC406